MPYRLYIVDDHSLMRRGYRSRLESEHDLRTGWELQSGRVDHPSSTQRDH